MVEIAELIKNIESDDNTNAEHIFHKLLELVISLTGRGEVEEDYTKTVKLPIGDATIVSDPYYGRIWINTDNDEEEIEDEKEIMALSNEIKKRILQFDKQIKETREKISDEIFDKSFKQVLK